MLLCRRMRNVAWIVAFLGGFFARCWLDYFLAAPVPQPIKEIPEVVDVAHLLLLVMIVSAPANTQQRHAIRETWLSQIKEQRQTKALFVVGTAGLSSQQQKFLEQEAKKYGDLLLLNIEDSYVNLTHKVLKMIEYAVARLRPAYLLKCDDDSFVRLDTIIRELEEWGNSSLYWGYFNGRAPVMTKGKWAENNYRLCDRYIPYALGGGYVLGSQLIRFIASNSHQLEEYRSEDVSVGSWLAGLLVYRKHDPRFDTEWRSRGCSHSYLVTQNQSPDMMRDKWDRVSRGGSLCALETVLRPAYKYDWSKPPSQCCAAG